MTENTLMLNGQNFEKIEGDYNKRVYLPSKGKFEAKEKFGPKTRKTMADLIAAFATYAPKITPRGSKVEKLSELSEHVKLDTFSKAMAEKILGLDELAALKMERMIFPDNDGFRNHLGGFQANSLNFIAGPSGSGRTSMLAGLALSFAKVPHYNVLFVSRETVYERRFENLAYESTCGKSVNDVCSMLAERLSAMPNTGPKIVLLDDTAVFPVGLTYVETNAIGVKLRMMCHEFNATMIVARQTSRNVLTTDEYFLERARLPAALTAVADKVIILATDVTAKDFRVVARIIKDRAFGAVGAMCYFNPKTNEYISQLTNLYGRANANS